MIVNTWSVIKSVLTLLLVSLLLELTNRLIIRVTFTSDFNSVTTSGYSFGSTIGMLTVMGYLLLVADIFIIVIQWLGGVVLSHKRFNLGWRTNCPQV